MEAVNEALTLISKAKEEVNSYLSMLEDHEVWETTSLENSLNYLEQAVQKLTGVPHGTS